MSKRGTRLLSLAAGLLAGGLAVLPAAAQVSAEQTVKSLKIAPGLEATLWASEPQLFKPTNMDIDARGRIWITEGVNYRSVHPRADGDRIIILDDTQHTGKCDNYKVFVQDTKLKAPLGICVLGNKVIVAQSPNMLIYTMDESGDRPVGPPQVIFTGFGGVDHDHGVHAGIFGPDGRYYFNTGNEGNHADLIKYGDYMKDKAGQPVVDIVGSQIGRKAAQFRGHPRQQGETGYREGLALSMNPDGSDLEVLGYNFRNNYELAVDSFGTVWQSDNDDDGNQGVAINYVMEGGNFGFTGPTGSSWGRDMQQYANIFKGQTRQEAHWHQRWPGVVPNLLNTGQGSPCGMIVYEGDLLPELYRGMVLHCDAGPNVVRAYITKFGTLRPAGIAKPVSADEAAAWEKEPGKGGGYEAKEIELMKASDRWFRPDDICVAPDGAVYISDWYDPGVGGHHTGDTGVNVRDSGWQTLHGRIYRLAPPGYKTSVPALDLNSVAGQIAALNSPNLARRYLGYAKLVGQVKASSSDVINALADQFTNNKNPRLRARALWLLATSSQGQKYVQDALKDKDVDIRITGIRAARHIKMDSIAVANQMIGDAATPVLRELCLAMQFEPTEKAIPVLLKLAEKYDGQDRWYLEAFGIGCIGREKEVLGAYQKAHPADDAQSKNIAWRLKMEPVQPSDADQASATPIDQALTSWWGVGPFAVEGGAAALDSQFGPEKSAAHVDLTTSYSGLDNKSIKWEKVAPAGRGGRGRTVSISQFATQHGFRAENVAGYFATALNSDTDRQIDLTLQSADQCKIWLNGAPVTAQSNNGELAAKLDLRKGKNLLMLKVVHQTGRGIVTASIYGPAAVTLLDDVTDATAPTAVATPAPVTPTVPDKQFKTKEGQILPTLGDLAKLTGDAKAGEKVFRNTTGANCIKCHQIGDEGQMIGPPLTVIGSKLSKPQLYEAILYPSVAIEMGYETYVVRTKGSDVFSGLKVEDTPDHITIKDTDAKFHDIPVDQVDKMVKQPISLMPEALNETMTKQELVDLVEYLAARKG